MARASWLSGSRRGAIARLGTAPAALHVAPDTGDTELPLGPGLDLEVVRVVPEAAGAANAAAALACVVLLARRRARG